MILIEIKLRIYGMVSRFLDIIVSWEDLEELGETPHTFALEF